MSNDVLAISFSNPSFIKQGLLKLTARHNNSIDVGGAGSDLHKTVFG